MAMSKKQQIRAIRIALTVFYGFLLSSTLFHYIIHGIVEFTRRPSNVPQIIMVVLGIIIIITIGLSTYATWFDHAIILLVSGIVLIIVFILTLVFGILRIIDGLAVNLNDEKEETTPNIVKTDDDSRYGSRPTSNYQRTTRKDRYVVAEDMTKLVIELIFILFAILATFFLYRYLRAKYSAVPTAEPGAAATTTPAAPAKATA